MVYTQYSFENMRDIFVEEIISIFGTTKNFLDAIDAGQYYPDFDFGMTECHECYIIDTDRGEYISWYKYTHIGRDIHIATYWIIEDENDVRDFIIRFLLRFKGK